MKKALAWLYLAGCSVLLYKGFESGFFVHWFNAGLRTMHDPFWWLLCITSGIVGYFLNPFEEDLLSTYGIKLNQTKAIVYGITCFLIFPSISLWMVASHW